MNNKKITGIVVILVLIVLAGGYFVWQKGPAPSASRDASVADSVQNLTYTIEARPVTLVNGRAESDSAPGSASKIVTRYFGNEASGDLDGDGRADRAFILTEDTGGSGKFYYVAVAQGTETGYRGTNAISLGDRIAPQSTEIKDGQLIVNYADRKAGEPMAAAPSLGVTKYFELRDGVLVEVGK